MFVSDSSMRFLRLVIQPMQPQNSLLEGEGIFAICKLFPHCR